MPNYYLAVEKVGEGCWEENGELKHFDLPNSYGFEFSEDAKKLKLGDKLVDYVAPNWGFAVLMEVAEWKKGQTYKLLSDTHWDYPFRVKVKVLCEIKYENLIPKWKDLRPNLQWCQGMRQKSAAQTLRHPLRQISKDDYELIAAAIYRGKAIEDSGKTNQGLSTSEFVEEVKKLAQKYDKKT